MIINDLLTESQVRVFEQKNHVSATWIIIWINKLLIYFNIALVKEKSIIHV